MPQASTLELLRKLQALCEEYAGRCTAIEIVGALNWVVHDVVKASRECGEEEGG